MIPSLLGHIVVALSVVGLAVSIPDEDIRRPMWIFVFLALTISAHFCWVHPKAPSTPRGWLKFAGVAVACGAFLAITDMVFWGIKSGHVILDLFVAVAGSVIAVSGAIRSFALGGKDDV